MLLLALSLVPGIGCGAKHARRALTAQSIERASLDAPADRSFGSGGVVRLPVMNQVDVVTAGLSGGVIAAGARAGAPPRGVVALVRDDGTVDPSFGKAGVQELPGRLGVPTAVAMGVDGRVLLTLAPEDSRTRDGTVVRLLPTGRRDPRFGRRGTVAVVGRRPTAVIAEPGGGILFAGLTDHQMFIERLRPDGRIDVTFGRRGRASATCGHQGEWDTVRLLRQPDGRLVIVGTTTVAQRSYGSDVPGEDDDDFCAAGLRVDGRADTTFGLHGRALIEVGSPPPRGTLLDQDIVTSAALDSHGAITIVGTIDGDHRQAFALVRLTRRGRPDRSFARDGRLTVRFSDRVEGLEHPSIAIDQSGRVWLAVVTYRGEHFTRHVYLIARDGRRITSLVTRGRAQREAARAWALALDDGRPLIAANVDWSGLGLPPSGHAVLMRLR